VYPLVGADPVPVQVRFIGLCYLHGMNQRTARIRFGLRLATLAAAVVVLGGCSTYYQSYYPDSGVYYGDSGVYGHSPGHSRVGYGPVNPVDYPYWSIDYFYFSQYYHPYSVFVGYNEPLYYPYPGWAFGHYRPARWHGSLAFGFGYPWYGHGYRYPAYTFGFFSGYDPYHAGRRYPHDRHGDHRIRRIDQRLQALQHDDSYASRRALLGRDRLAGRSGTLYDNRDRSRADAVRSQSRTEMLRQRGSNGSRALQRRDAAPDRAIQRRAPDVRSDRRTLDRNRIRRDGAGTAAEGHRGIPIDRLRGRVIVNSGSRSGGSSSGSSDARDRDATRRDRAAAQRGIRRAPARDWNSGERRSRQQAPDRASRSADNASRGSVRNRSSRKAAAPPPRRPERRAAPPSRPARDARNISRPEPASRASSPSRRSIMRQRSNGDGGRDRRDRRDRRH